MDGRPISDSAGFVEIVQESPGRRLQVGVLRDGREVILEVIPDGPVGEARIGIGLGVLQRYGPLKAVVESAKYNVDIARQTFSVLGKIFTGQLGARSISGPIEIAAMSGAAARSGFRNLLYLMGLISISIGILNLLPIPMLDGGQVTVLLIESLRQRDLSLIVKEAHSAGRVLHDRHADGGGAIFRSCQEPARGTAARQLSLFIVESVQFIVELVQRGSDIAWPNSS